MSYSLCECPTPKPRCLDDLLQWNWCGRCQGMITAERLQALKNADTIDSIVEGIMAAGRKAEVGGRYSGMSGLVEAWKVLFQEEGEGRWRELGECHGIRISMPPVKDKADSNIKT